MSSAEWWPARLLLYIIFRLVRTLVEAESRVVVFVRRLIWAESGVVEYSHILARMRLSQWECARDADFLTFHDSFGQAEELQSPEWCIYALSSTHVFLVHLPSVPPSIEDAPRMTDSLHSTADRVARISWQHFQDVSHRIGPFKSRVVMLHSVPASGGTCAGELLQACDPSCEGVLVWGEPPFLSSLALLEPLTSIESMHRFVHATLKFALQHQNKFQTVVLKTRSCCIRLVPYVHAGTPSVQHVFVSSRQPLETVARLARRASPQHAPAFQLMMDTLSFSPAFCNWLTTWRMCEPHLIYRVGPKEAFEVALAFMMGATIQYQKTLSFYALETIYFEDLISDTSSVVRPLLGVCGIDELCLPECIEWKRRIEPLLKESWGGEELTEEQQDRVKQLVDLIQADWAH